MSSNPSASPQARRETARAYELPGPSASRSRRKSRRYTKQSQIAPPRNSPGSNFCSEFERDARFISASEFERDARSFHCRIHEFEGAFDKQCHREFNTAADHLANGALQAFLHCICSVAPRATCIRLTVPHSSADLSELIAWKQQISTYSGVVAAPQKNAQEQPRQ